MRKNGKGGRATSDFDSYIGTVFDERYTIVSVIGHGESSVVFGAVDKTNDTTVALKMLHKSREEYPRAAERFLAEAHVLSLFDHPNIVKLLDQKLDGEHPYFVMEYIEGITLKTHILSTGSLSFDEILFLSEMILSAIDEVHRHGVIHCDIKPQNIVIVANGQIKLMDFGICRAELPLYGREENKNVAVGTVHYVSPEQAQGLEVTAASDLYSFGIMLYEMATGVLPFISDNPNRIASMQVNCDPTPPSEYEDTITPATEAVILKAIEKEPSERYQSASDLLAALRAIPETDQKLREDANRSDRKVIEGIQKSPPDAASCFIGALLALLLSLLLLLPIYTAFFRSGNYFRMPELVGKSFPECGTLVNSSDYIVKIELVDADESNAGKILSQSPKAGTILNRKKGKVPVGLSVGKRTLGGTMPDFTFLPLSEVQKELAFFEVDVEVGFADSDAYPYLPSGRIASQSPAPGEPFTGTGTVTFTVIP